MTQTYYTKDIDGEYSVAQPQPTLREMEPEDIDDTMSVAERAVRIVLAKAKGVCLSKVHATDHAGNSYLREASATQCANAIGALNIQPLIDQVHGILSLPTQPEPPADVARDAEPVAYFTGYNNGYPTIAPINPALCMAIGTALYSAPPAPSAPDKTSCLSTGGMTVWGDSVSIEKCNNFVHLASQAAGFKDELINTRAELRQQRGKLLVALEKCRDMVGHPDNIAFIDAAIAEVKGPK